MAATKYTSNILHIAMFPWFGTGHMTPYVHLSNELAKRGHRVTLLLPQKAQLELQHFNNYPHLITLHTLTIPHVEGLPHGTETALEIPFPMLHLLAIAIDKIRDQVEQTLGAIKPDFLFYDLAYWIPQIAKKFGIKTICFNVISAASLALALVPAKKIPGDRHITDEELCQPPEGYPSSKVVVSRTEVKSLSFLPLPFGDGNITLYERWTTALRESDAIAIRTTREMEGKFCDYLEAQYMKKVLLTGPMLPNEVEGKLEEKWANWLDGFGPGSVVFCAFGSQSNLEKDQFQELLLGFELSGLPFFVALRAPNGCQSVEEALPEGFEERVKGRGIVSRGWVQQLLILKHPSVGCFVNHCGFGSMWESLMSDKQIVLAPQLGDQVLDTKLLVEELEVAVQVERGENGWISKENWSKAIKSVMDGDSEVGAKVKKNHLKWKETRCCPKLFDGYVDNFVQSLQEFSV